MRKPLANLHLASHRPLPSGTSTDCGLALPAQTHDLPSPRAILGVTCSLTLSLSHTHTHAHAHAHAHTCPARARCLVSHTRSHFLSLKHTHTHTHAHAHTHTHTPAQPPASDGLRDFTSKISRSRLPAISMALAPAPFRTSVAVSLMACRAQHTAYDVESPFFGVELHIHTNTRALTHTHTNTYVRTHIHTHSPTHSLPHT